MRPADAAEQVARTSYGRLIALLAASTGDLALAEDALASAFERALSTWPDDGVPANPEGWLLTVARNRQRDTWKSAAHRTSDPLEFAADQVSPLDDLDPEAIGDRRLELLFVCAHPAIDAAIRTPLMLQTVLGFEAAQIAAAFAVPPAAMAQRLVRAKRRIKNTRIPFVVPEPQDRPERVAAVLEAVYGCYAIAGTGDLADEAHYLAVTLAALLPTEPEAWALAALIALSRSRATARDADFVPLDEQNTTRWDRELIAEGESYLRRASGGQPGRFQLEAAIQAVHCDRARTQQTDWPALHTLYSALITIAPTLGAQVALAAVTARIHSPAAGLDALDQLDAETFQPLHATRGELLAQAGRPAEAAAAFTTAASLTTDEALQSYLLGRAATCRR
ncbi:RNA polymerase subunit sigma-70 [Kribbella sandramycini]|uniref:RNA polymerase sigma-70 factor (ECF subfamily) n=1 Tax=Kribbella sandramycini TaxID=60450 RepID=A0A7Y4P466_9ACTN|nr:DUF6596 domain-containing protein [Kribbella sandramycini]MBB6570269.1 RNA polymerase sigma-70 factor (ECF subfamily) [Kribbella sandramycini]NOL45813.1 RNA polymerase subunit sigma-70 [Kribbella sandramycini]